MTERSGVEIDYCPNCRGIWLDRGELDKIIERSAEHYHGKETNEYREKDKYYDHEKKHQYKKKKGFLGDLFDFD